MLLYLALCGNYLVFHNIPLAPVLDAEGVKGRLTVKRASDPVGYFVYSDVTVIFVWEFIIEPIYEKCVSKEPPLNLHGIMCILDPPVKPEISCKDIQVQYSSTDNKR